MQKDLKSLQEKRIQLVAVSYDSVDVLLNFAKEGEIRFALLSDPDSKTIEAYHIRNKELKDSPIDGVPYPGTFLVGQDGIIHAKLFYDGYKKRHHAEDIIKAAEKLPKKKAD